MVAPSGAVTLGTGARSPLTEQVTAGAGRRRVGEGGFEPPTASSQSWCATTAPLPGNALLATCASVSSRVHDEPAPCACTRENCPASDRGNMKLATRVRSGLASRCCTDGSRARHRLVARPAGAAASGPGYWMLGSDGGVFSFSVPFLGSAACHRPARVRRTSLTAASPTAPASFRLDARRRRILDPQRRQGNHHRVRQCR